MVVISNGMTGQADLVIVVNGVVVAQEISGITAWSFWRTLSAVVPPGQTYYAYSNYPGAVLTRWAELR